MESHINSFGYGYGINRLQINNVNGTKVSQQKIQLFSMIDVIDR